MNSQILTHFAGIGFTQKALRDPIIRLSLSGEFAGSRLICTDLLLFMDTLVHFKDLVMGQ